MISVGIDVSKDKHDCFIVNSEGEVLADVFTIHNTMDGFNFLLQRIRECTMPQDKIKVGLEATGHYSYNLLGFLLDNFTEKASVSERPKPTGWMHERLPLCCYPMRASSPTQIQHTTTRN